MLAARRAVDDQDARRARAIVLAALRFPDGITRGQPVDGDLVFGVGKTRPALRVNGALREWL